MSPDCQSARWLAAKPRENYNLYLKAPLKVSPTFLSRLIMRKRLGDVFARQCFFLSFFSPFFFFFHVEMEGSACCFQLPWFYKVIYFQEDFKRSLSTNNRFLFERACVIRDIWHVLNLLRKRSRIGLRVQGDSYQRLVITLLIISINLYLYRFRDSLEQSRNNEPPGRWRFLASN